jgi:hypothetical protein
MTMRGNEISFYWGVWVISTWKIVITVVWSVGPSTWRLQNLLCGWDLESTWRWQGPKRVVVSFKELINTVVLRRPWHASFMPVLDHTTGMLPPKPYKNVRIMITFIRFCTHLERHSLSISRVKALWTYVVEKTEPPFHVQHHFFLL